MHHKLVKKGHHSFLLNSWHLGQFCSWIHEIKPVLIHLLSRWGTQGLPRNLSPTCPRPAHIFSIRPFYIPMNSSRTLEMISIPVHLKWGTITISPWNSVTFRAFTFPSWESTDIFPEDKPRDWQQCSLLAWKWVQRLIIIKPNPIISITEHCLANLNNSCRKDLFTVKLLLDIILLAEL